MTSFRDKIEAAYYFITTVAMIPVMAGALAFVLLAGLFVPEWALWASDRLAVFSRMMREWGDDLEERLRS